MQLQVRPAKRGGNAKTIFDEPLSTSAISRYGDRVVVSVAANSIYRDKSTYLYTLEFTADEVDAMFGPGR
jgi:hypothetical protein